MNRAPNPFRKALFRGFRLRFHRSQILPREAHGHDAAHCLTLWQFRASDFPSSLLLCHGF
jgi:hypothetical protein